MGQTPGPLWRLVASQYRHSNDATLNRHVSAALGSAAVRLQRGLLEPLGLRIAPEPALWKYLPGPCLRLFFRVEGDSPEVEEGQVIALVLLHDPGDEQTLYAHPVHAGPRANPTLKHIYGPMAAPKAQEGANGDRATLRLLEHKRAIWDRFLLERDKLGSHEAGQRWRERYFWTLVRLYFCERCSRCRWGSPSFDGPPGEPYLTPQPEPIPTRVTPELPAGFFEQLRESSAWAIETAYVRRGGFSISPMPVLATMLGSETAFVAFPTDVEFVEPGVPIGLAFYADASSAEVRHAHTLTAGPDPEPALLFGDRALGLPGPRPGGQSGPARESYVRRRRQDWSLFWLNELEEGLHAASRCWLAGYWNALGELFGMDSRSASPPR